MFNVLVYFCENAFVKLVTMASEYNLIKKIFPAKHDEPLLSSYMALYISRFGNIF